MISRSLLDYAASTILICIVFFVAFKAFRSGKSIDDYINENSRKFFTTLSMMSTIAEAIALIFFSVDRGNGLLMSIMRYGILSTLEIVTSFFLIKKFMDSLKDGKFSFMELFFTLIYFIFNVGTTYILLICYLESIGAITFNYDPTSWTMIKSVQGTNTRVEISAVVLIVSTLFFNCALMYFHWRKINDDKIDKKYGKQGNLFDKEQNKKDRENGVGVNERMDKRAEQEKK